MPQMSLTRQQKRCLDAYAAGIRTSGIAPSMRDVARHMGISVSGVHRLLVALEERGHIVRAPNRARAISLRSAA